MSVTVFLSYSSEQSDAATRIELSLQGDGHAVFRDRSALPPGESFDARIRASIEESDLFIFLISGASISPGHYTLTELKFAEEKWGHPAGRVLPVFAEPTPTEAIPPFLRAVTILQPRGDIAAEVAAAVARMSAPWWRRLLEPRRLAPMVFVALVLAGGAWLGLPSYLERREQTAQAGALVKESRAQADSGNYADAWKLLEQANAVAPGSSDVLAAQESLAMELLRRAPGSDFGGPGTFKDLVDMVTPVLSRGVAGAKGERAANLLAHLGWAEYLRERAGVGGLDPARYYRRALEADPGNVFAQAMWGFEILRRGRDSLAEARPHFAAALESRREREYVRHLQLSALLRIENPEWEHEVIRIASEMRNTGEPRPEGFIKRRLWTLYHYGLAMREQKARFLAALPPAEHLALFLWLFPERELPKDQRTSLFYFLFVLAQLQEHGGDRPGALASYQRLLSEFADKRFTSGDIIRMVDDASAAIKRLSS